MDRMEKDTSAEETSAARDVRREATIDSLTDLESYYQSRYEYYLAMATEAKENRERVGLLLLDLSRDVLTSFGSEEDLHSSKDIQKMRGEQNRDRELAPDRRVNFELPQTDSPKEPEESATTLLKDESLAPSVSQMKKWTLDLAQAMSIIELASSSDSGKALHQNYLHHLINHEFERQLSPELVELYLEEAIRRGYLELDEFDNNCYIAKPKSDSNSKVLVERSNTGQKDSEAFSHSAQLPLTSSSLQISNIATEKATNSEQPLKRESGKPYDLPESDRLKPTLLKTIEGYIENNRPKRFSIDDVINYLYPQHTQLNWDKNLKNKVRSSISNVLSRKAYLGKYWTRIKLGVYRPSTKDRR